MAQSSVVRKGHPRALYILFFTELWERFGYYLLTGILLLYLLDPRSHGGKGFDTRKATDLLGSFIALVYLTPFIGGLLADRVLGYRRAVIIGGTLLACGYYGLAIPGDTAMYISLLLVIIGNGFFKPNISTILGNIYNREDLKPRKDLAYNIFYMGINIGAFICNFVAAYMRNNKGWGYAFACAGVGMTIALIWFISWFKELRPGDIPKPKQPEDMPLGKIFGLVFLPAIGTALIGWFMQRWIGHPLFGSRSDDAFMFALVPIIIFYISIYVRSAREDRPGLGALFAFFLVAIVFWTIYNQNVTGLTLWADQYTNREMSPSMEKLARPFGMIQTVSTDSQLVTRINPHFKAILDENGNTVTVIGIHPYFHNLPKSQWPKSGKLRLVSTEIFQSVNPFFIVLFTPLLVILFSKLARRNREPSTPIKITLGTWMAGLSSLIMVLAIASSHIYSEKSSMIWLIATYAIFTIGEILVSPIGLSMVSKLAPARLTALMMGAWFLVNSLGGKLAGMMATFWDSFTDKKGYFLILVVAAAIAGLIMLMLSKKLAKTIHEKTGSV